MQTQKACSIQDSIIKTISYDQEEIIKWVLELYCPDGIQLDPTYSKGNFYKNIPAPEFKYDLSPCVDGVVEANCCNLPHESNSIGSIMFDPPFVAAIPKGEATGIITKRFSYYRNIQHEMWDMYFKALSEFMRILKPNGVLIFKCQDTIDSCKQYFSHSEIHNMAVRMGFYAKDLFILLAKNRLIGATHRKQQHARKYHSYFLVFIKQESKVKYRYINKEEGTDVSDL